jgi:ribosomal-protein-alanine N-acetyltransferase
LDQTINPGALHLLCGVLPVRNHAAVSAVSRVRIGPPTEAQRRIVLDAVRRSQRLHDPWVAPPTTDQAYDSWLTRQATPSFEGFLITLAGEAQLVGFCNLSYIVRGDLGSAFMGFAAVDGFQGQGYMREGLDLVLDQAFGRIGLHRVEANVQPGNEPSRVLVARLGFVKEGFSESYLRVGGEWRDHERWAIRAELREPPGIMSP